MISQEKWMILTPSQKLPNNVGNLGKIIVATGFEWLPKMQKIAQSGHTVNDVTRLKGKLRKVKCLNTCLPNAYLANHKKST